MEGYTRRSSSRIDHELHSNTRTDSLFILAQPKDGSSTLARSQRGISTSNNFRVGPSSLNKPPPGISTLSKLQTAYPDYN